VALYEFRNVEAPAFAISVSLVIKFCNLKYCWELDMNPITKLYEH